MTVKERIVKRFRKIANDHGITYNEVQKVFKSQFEFTKDVIEKQDMSGKTDKELEKLVFTYLYLGKVYTNKKLKEFGNRKNKIEDDKE